MNSVKKRVFYAGLCSVICILFAVFAVISLQKTHGSFNIKVVDAYTNMPLEKALIVVAENDLYFTTDEHGRAFCSNISFVDTSPFKALKNTESSTVTLLCYKSGYLDFVLFNAAVSSVGIGEKTLYMFPVSGEGERTFIAMNETPNDEFAKKLLEKYAP